MKRRALEVLVLAFGAVFLAVVFFSFRPGHRPSPRSSSETLPRVPPAAEAGQATTVLKGFDYAETVGGKPLFRIQSERTVGFGAAAGMVPNVYALEKVSLTVYPDQGAPVTVHADRAQYDHRTNEARLEGNVRWIDEKGALAESEKVEFNPSSRRLVAPGAVHFAHGAFDVHARSAVYDLAKHELGLEGPVRGSGTGVESGGLSTLSSRSAAYRRDEGIIELAGKVSGSSVDGDSLSCDRLVLKTEAEGKRFEWARAEGSVQGVISSKHQSGNQSSASATPPGNRRYAGSQGSLLFAPDGSVRSLALTGVPASVEERERKVYGDAIDLVLENGRPTSAAARGSVRIEAGDRRAQSDRASIAFAASGEIQTLELSGSVRTQGEGKSARAEKAIELPARGVWILTGDQRAGATVESGGSRVSAATIEIEKGKGLRAEGEARAVFMQQGAQKKALSLVADPARPTFGRSDRMVFNDAAKVATLSGKAMLWQDASSLFGDDITLNDSERTVVAVGHARAVLTGHDEQASKEADRRPSVITARRVLYRETLGTALFEESVAVTRGPWRAKADKATAYLGRDNRVERAEMTGNVSLSDSSTGRSAGAARLLDLPLEDRTVLEGSPAWVTDNAGGRVSGAVLTIRDRGRRVEVTAPEKGKTETIYKTRSQ